MIRFFKTRTWWQQALMVFLAAALLWFFMVGILGWKELVVNVLIFCLAALAGYYLSDQNERG